MSASDNANRYAPPVAPTRDLPEAGGLELASRWARVGALLIDALLVGVPCWLIQYFVLHVDFKHPDPSFAARLQALLLGTVFTLLVNGMLLARQGRTVGKRVLGLRIARPDGRLPGGWRALGLRQLLPMLLQLGPMWLMGLYGLVDCFMIFGSARRCLHDRIADTIVVRA